MTIFFAFIEYLHANLIFKLKHVKCMFESLEKIKQNEILLTI